MSQRNQSEPTHQERRQQRAREEAERRRQARLRKRLLLVGSFIALLVLVVAVGYVLVQRSAPPAGTQVFAETDHSHTTSPVHYDHVPPAGGAHTAVWLNCGIYDQPVPNESAVHSLEHGAVWITYQPSLPSSEVATLRQIVTAHYVGTQRYLLLSLYPGLPAPIVASAWGAQLRLQNAQDPRLVAFIQHYAGGGQGGEKGAPCTNGTGVPLR